MNEVEKDGGMERKNITIQVIDEQDNKQHFLLQVMTDGKDTKNIPVLPQTSTMIIDDNEKTKIGVNLTVPYTIRAFKTNLKSTQELKNQSIKSNTNLLGEVEFTPTDATHIIKINVNSNLP
ncbi:hypothetical protein SAMN05444673_3962 [Bacillus sp. OV166]|uniref:hypothetical protein n=1 Tax=Bacillus sp. OV166 TaxID=1882763 RepID=UPI000A2AD29C|nr:hypothetical protein [Bacillus sp. OV166]SMQ80645.1 hypothetical protein SAMN05444673_3962 [Bacillus sp. OV166]